MIQAYKSFWSQAFNFKGRTSRADFWSVWLIHLIICIALLLLLVAFSITEFIGIFIGPGIFAAAIPNLSLEIRRLRDAGRDWKWMIFGFIPFIGPIWLFVLLVEPTMEIDGGYD